MNILYNIKKLIQAYRYRHLEKGDGTRINVGVSINNPRNVIIGRNSYINGGCLSVGKHSKIIIGNDCLISYNVHFRTMTHNYEKKDKLIRLQGEYEKDIVIEDDVWIGYGVQIMPGVTVHTGAVVGAGAVVTHDVESYTVVGGGTSKENKIKALKNQSNYMCS